LKERFSRSDRVRRHAIPQFIDVVVVMKYCCWWFMLWVFITMELWCDLSCFESFMKNGLIGDLW